MTQWLLTLRPLALDDQRFREVRFALADGQTLSGTRLVAGTNDRAQSCETQISKDVNERCKGYGNPSAPDLGDKPGSLPRAATSDGGKSKCGTPT